MPITAFKSSRVTEALHAIEVYVNQAWELADAVQPSDTLKLELEGETEAGEAEVTEVVWTATDSSLIELSDLTETPEIRVKGENLTHLAVDEHGNAVLDANGDPIWLLDVASVKLVGPDGEGACFVAIGDDFDNVGDGEFTAELTLVDGAQPQLGPHEVVIVTIDGDIEVLTNACQIVPDKTRTKDDILKVLILNRRRGRGRGKLQRRQQARLAQQILLGQQARLAQAQLIQQQARLAQQVKLAQQAPLAQPAAAANKAKQAQRAQQAKKARKAKKR
jgi:hypothetical protein